MGKYSLLREFRQQTQWYHHPKELLAEKIRMQFGVVTRTMRHIIGQPWPPNNRGKHQAKVSSDRHLPKWQLDVSTVTLVLLLLRLRRLMHDCMTDALRPL